MKDVRKELPSRIIRHGNQADRHPRRSQAIDYGVALDLGDCFWKQEDKGCHVVVFDEACAWN